MRQREWLKVRKGRGRSDLQGLFGDKEVNGQEGGFFSGLAHILYVRDVC